MINNRGKNRPGLDKWFVIISAVLAAIMISIAAYAIIFLSNNLFKAFVPRDAAEEGARFDLEGYNEVLEALGRTPSVSTTTTSTTSE